MYICFVFVPRVFCPSSVPLCYELALWRQRLLHHTSPTAAAAVATTVALFSPQC